MQSSLTNSATLSLLETLYADAAKNDPLVHQAAREQGASHKNEAEFYKAVNKAYMPVSREFGNLLYILARGSRAKTIVEFGTSFGISTIFLAAAIRDNGAGKVITTEFEAEKAARAKQNLASIGLDKYVEFRVGDALETLHSHPPTEIDLVLLDGAKGLYLPVLKILEPHLRSGGLVASDNTDHDGMEPFLKYLRAPSGGYSSSAILTMTDRGHEVSVRH